MLRSAAYHLSHRPWRRRVLRAPKIFNAPLSWFHSHSAAEFGAGNASKPNVFDWLREIESCKTHDDISGMFLMSLPGATGYRNINAHYSVVNFDNCVHHISVATGTIEFRQHEGTLNHSEICAWVELTAMLTQFCDNASARQIVSLCGHAWDHEFTVFDLMDTLGCRHELTNFYRLQLRRARGECQARSILHFPG